MTYNDSTLWKSSLPKLLLSLVIFCRAIIISGGPGSVNDPNPLAFDPDIFNLDTPILGICYGLQLINKHFGGTVERKETREDGQFKIKVDPTSSIFHGLEEQQEVLLTHGDSVNVLADCCKVTAQSGGLVAAIAHKEKQVYGVQFHPEVDLTENGTAILKNFLYNVSDPSFLPPTMNSVVVALYVFRCLVVVVTIPLVAGSRAAYSTSSRSSEMLKSW